jgi:CRP/FNR family transcriptional regulator
MTASALIGALKRHPIWTNAGEQTLRALAARGREVKFRRGEAILSAGEPADSIFLLLEGAVRVFYPSTPHHAEVTVKLFWAPAAFGDAESILRAHWAETVQALTAGRVFVTPAAQYFKLMRSDPEVCFRQYWDVSRRFGVAIRSERAANFSELRDRVVALLVAYAHHFGVERSDGVLIDHELSQDELASQVSAKRRTIARALAELYDRRLVLRSGRKFVIPDLDALLEGAREAPDISFRSDEIPWAER